MVKADREITSAASAWIAQLETGGISAEDLAALHEWMGRSPAHAQEIRAIAKLSGQLSALTDLMDRFDAETVARPRRLARRWAPAAALGAAGGVLALAVILAPIAFDRAPTPAPEIYRTAVGEYRAFAFDDGSDITLNTDSQIEVDFDAELRRVRLVAGEAYFDVAHDPARPFVVYTDTSVMQAVGTAFVVRMRPDATELDVVEGAVSVSELPVAAPAELALGAATLSRADARVIVPAGHSLTYAAADPAFTLSEERIAALAPREMQRKLSWTEGLFDFSDTSLEDVVAELSRHSGLTFEFADPALKDMKFGGIFRTGDIDTLFEVLETLGVTVRRVDDEHVVLELAASN